MFKNRSAQAVSEANCRARLSYSKHCFKRNVCRNKHYLIQYQKVVYTSHIKNPMTHCTQLPQQRKAVAAKWRT